jgi:DNA-binding MarR family transcriptional regulator
MADFDREDIVRLRAALGRISKLIDRQVEAGDLTRTQLEVLGAITNHGALGVSELAEHVAINPTMLSRILTKLEDAGLVLRSAADEDRRAVRVAPTPAGTRLSTKVRGQRTKLLAERLELLAEVDADLLLAALPALESLAQAMATKPVRA